MIKKILVVILAVMLHISVNAQSSMDYAPIEQVLKKELGDSVSNIILNSDSIVGHLTIWENDSLPDVSLSSCMCHIVKYTLCNPSMYKSDRRIYASFYADACFMITLQTKTLTLELDYSTYKWRLLDSDGKQVCRHDLPDQAMLPLLHIIWPESKIVNIKYNKYLQSNET